MELCAARVPKGIVVVVSPDKGSKVTVCHVVVYNSTRDAAAAYLPNAPQADPALTSTAGPTAAASPTGLPPDPAGEWPYAVVSGFQATFFIEEVGPCAGYPAWLCDRLRDLHHTEDGGHRVQRCPGI